MIYSPYEIMKTTKSVKSAPPPPSALSKEPPPSAQERAEKLRKVIEHHRYLYHVLDTQEITDAALDSLKNELAELEKEYPSLITPDSPTQRVGGSPLPEFKKIRHRIPQWSFNDAFTPEEMREFDARVKRMLAAEFAHDISPSYICELKIDGLKIVLTYEKGVLVTAATRGDGITGEEVTENVKTIESVPLRLTEEADIIVEGEIWMPANEFARINHERKEKGETEFANPRNAAAGSIRQLDPKIAASRKLDSFIYDMASDDSAQGKSLKTQVEELERLRHIGFKVNQNFRHCKSMEEVVAYWREWEKKKDRQKYWIDGVAVKVNEREYQERLGYTGKAPRFAIAFKFPAEQVTTIVEGIALQIGRTGVLTPVAHLKPVSIAGSIVSRATLHNEDEINRLDIRVGDTVILQKAGDVIPDVVSVVKDLRTGKEKKFHWPKKVAACGGEGKDAGKIERVPGQAAWRCAAKNSLAQNKRKLYHFAGKHAFDIEHLGPKNIDLLVENNLVVDFDDIFTLTKGDLLALPRFAEKSAENLLAAIAARREIPLARFLVALSIPTVGEETAEDIAKHFGTLQNVQKAKREELENIYGVGAIVGRSVHEWFDDPENRDLAKRLEKQVKVLAEKKIVSDDEQEKKLRLKNLSFVFTGSLSFSRDGAKKKVKALGGEVHSSVSQNTAYVVAGENPGSKYQTAQKLGVKIIGEKEFEKLISLSK